MRSVHLIQGARELAEQHVASARAKTQSIGDGGSASFIDMLEAQAFEEAALHTLRAVEQAEAREQDRLDSPELRKAHDQLHQLETDGLQELTGKLDKALAPVLAARALVDDYNRQLRAASSQVRVGSPGALEGFDSHPGELDLLAYTVRRLRAGAP